MVVAKLLQAIGATVLVVAIVIVLLGWPTMLLWNCLVPDLFGLRPIGFWQAVGLCLLAKCFFSSGYVSATK